MLNAKQECYHRMPSNTKFSTKEIRMKNTVGTSSINHNKVAHICRHLLFLFFFFDKHKLFKIIPSSYLSNAVLSVIYVT